MICTRLVCELRSPLRKRGKTKSNTSYLALNFNVLVPRLRGEITFEKARKNKTKTINELSRTAARLPLSHVLAPCLRGVITFKEALVSL